MERNKKFTSFDRAIVVSSKDEPINNKIIVKTTIMNFFTRAIGCWFVVLLFLSSSTTFGQSDQEYVRCETMEADAALREQYPEMGTLNEFEKWLAPAVRRYHEVAQARSVVTLPIVFHIIHDGEAIGSGDNVAAAYVQAQLSQLNNDFRRLAGTSGFNDNPVGADTEIQFCFAQNDPAGNPLAETGIDRIDRTTMGWGEPPYNRTFVESFIKPETQFDPERYINVWIVNMEGYTPDSKLLGFAQFPSRSGLDGIDDNAGLAETDGIAIAPFTVGSTETPNPSGDERFGKGRTLTHEMGHFFGLRHIWGDGGCGVDDFCEDTPQSDASNSGCESGHISCGSVDMIENYMDYSDDACMNIFTQDQKARMQAVMINSPRRGILAGSTECSGLPYADFSANKTTIYAGENIQFTDLTANGPDSWSWSFEGGSPTSSTEQNPVISYATPGVYTVSLSTSNVNGSDEETKVGFITVEPVVESGCTGGISSYPYFESFEGSLGGWTQSGSDDFDWRMNAGQTPSSATGPRTAVDGAWYLYTEASNNFNNTSLLTSPCFDLSSAASAQLSFAYHMLGSHMGALSLEISTDNGENWAAIWSRSGDQGSQWRIQPIDLSDYTSYPGIQLRFVGQTGHSFRSDMAIDDVKLTIIPHGPAPEADFSASATKITAGEPVQFTDLSAAEPDHWAWSFPGGSPANSSEQHPVVRYDTPGAYPVSLIATNAVGSDTLTKTGFITVSPPNYPPCSGEISTYPYAESFENGLGGWSQNEDDDFDWTRYAGNTASSATGPGNAAEGTWYLYTESSSNFNNTSILTSPCFDLEAANTATFSFQYHMYGESMGTLSLEISEDDQNSWTTLWSTSGDQGNEWRRQQIDLTEFAGRPGIQVRFYGQTGGSFRSDIAIDDLSLTITTAEAPPLADFIAGATTIVAGESVDFTDLSTEHPTSWMWEFEGGQPATSTEQDPTVSYPAPGIYAVSLTATNANGSHTNTKTNYITVHPKVVPGCSGGISSYPYIESFEHGLGGWSQDGADDFDWTRNAGGTPSSQTGPNSASDGTWYLFVESTKNFNNTGILNSPCFNLSGLAAAGISFQYHMFGAGMGSLELQISIDDGRNWTSLWSRSGDQGNNWHEASIDLSAYGGQSGVSFRFVGITGDNFRSDMAIDDIRISSGSSFIGKKEDRQALNRIDDSLKIMPNPVSSQLFFSWSSDVDQPSRVVVTDMLGRVVLQKDWRLFEGKNRENINVGELKSGAYILLLQVGKEVHKKRFIKLN